MKMKKIALLITLLITLSCSKDSDSNIPSEGYDRVFPLLIVNEGGSVSRYDQSSNEYKTDIYGGVANNGIGGSPHFASKWIDTLYVVSRENGFGNMLSAYNNVTGRFLRGYTAEEGVSGSAFAVVNNKMGVLTTYGGGAIVVNMSDMTVKGTLKGCSQNTGDIIVAGNFLFLIDDNSRLLAYSLKNLETAEPQDLGAAVGGFTIDNSGFLWAYHNASTYDQGEPVRSDQTVLIKIDPKDLNVNKIDIQIPIMPSFLSYRAGLMTASSSENVLFFIQSAEVKNSVIYKYDYEKGTTKNFYTLDGTSTLIRILYNPSNNTITAITRKNESLVDYRILTIDATSGRLRQSFSYPKSSSPTPTFMLLN